MTLILGRNAEDIPDQEPAASAAVALAGAAKWAVVEERAVAQRFATAVAYRA